MLVKNNISAKIDENISATYFNLDKVRREYAADQRESTILRLTSNRDTDELPETLDYNPRESFSTRRNSIYDHVEQEITKFNVLTANY